MAEQQDGKAQPRKRTASKPEAHQIEVNDQPVSYVEQGGQAIAECTCGWNRSVPYNRDRLARGAMDQARKYGEAHAADPDAAETED